MAPSPWPPTGLRQTGPRLEPRWPASGAVYRKLGYSGDRIECHVRGAREAVLRRLRQDLAAWQATRYIPEIDGLAACPPSFGLSG
jgi:hypothetical protein